MSDPMVMANECFVNCSIKIMSWSHDAWVLVLHIGAHYGNINMYMYMALYSVFGCSEVTNRNHICVLDTSL